MPTIDLTDPELVHFTTPAGSTALVPFENYTPPELRGLVVEAHQLVAQYDAGADVGADLDTFARAHVDNPTMLDGLTAARLVRVVRAFRDYAPIRHGDEAAFPAYVQPTGAHDAYPLGYVVTHNGSVWRSAVDANVWEPGSVGAEALWQQIGPVVAP